MVLLKNSIELSKLQNDLKASLYYPYVMSCQDDDVSGIIKVTIFACLVKFKLRNLLYFMLLC